MEPYPESSPESSPRPVEEKRQRAWPLCLGLVAIAVVVGYAYLSNRPEREPDYNYSDLPEWFDRAHRVMPAEQVQAVEGIGLLLPPPIEPSKEFDTQWLERNFTHYVRDNAFVWATPKQRYPSHGKIMAGTKVISSGKQVSEFTLVAAVSKDGRIFNLFMGTAFLRDRSQGPPKIEDDD
jgi:hypothetical protein